MQGTTSYLTPRGPDEFDFDELVEVFGSSISLADITSAYMHANRDANVAANILSTRGNATNSAGNSTVTSSQLSSQSDHLSGLPPVSSSDGVLQNPYSEERRISAPNSNRSSVSMGSISSFIGKGYAQPQKSVNKCCEPTKPLKLHADEWFVPGILNEKDASYTKPGSSSMDDNIQDFLWKMLENGFQLDQEQIRKILGLCGYDMKTGMEHLFQLSASTLKKSDDIVGISEKMSVGKHLGLEHLSSQELQYQDSGPSDGATARPANLRGPQKEKKNNNDLQKEILQSLFTVPDRSDHAPRKIVPRRTPLSLNLVPVVDKPFLDTLDEACSHVTVTEEPQDAKECEEEDDEDSYDILRQAVTEYWVTMKEYYKSAVDAFSRGEHALADKLLAEGHIFYERARKADEKSAEKLFNNTRNSDTMVLNLRFHDTKGALRLLETHLTSLSGIPGMNLKVILGNDEDTKKEARKRLKVLKLLEEASIQWSEDDNGRVLCIAMENINPKTVKFPKR